MDEEENSVISFEYRVETLPNLHSRQSHSVEWLNQIGVDGWMLCCIVGTQAYFARALMVDEEDDGSVA